MGSPADRMKAMPLQQEYRHPCGAVAPPVWKTSGSRKELCKKYKVRNYSYICCFLTPWDKTIVEILSDGAGEGKLAELPTVDIS